MLFRLFVLCFHIHFDQITPSKSWIYRDLSTCCLMSAIFSFQTGMDATLFKLYVHVCVSGGGGGGGGAYYSPSSGVPV